MRIKPAFGTFKSDYEKYCPICGKPVKSGFVNGGFRFRIYCDEECATIKHHLSSARNFALRKKLKFTFKIGKTNLSN